MLAGRVEPDWENYWPGFMGSTQTISMSGMLPEDLRELINKIYTKYTRGKVADPRQVNDIVDFARGLPMIARTVVKLMVNHDMRDFQKANPEVVKDLVKKISEYVPQGELRTFKIAAILRFFNRDSLEALLTESDEADKLFDVGKLFDELKQWPFVRRMR